MRKFIFNFIISLLIIAPLFVSCIKEEAFNAEADINSATIENASRLLQTEPIIGDNTILFRLKQFPDNYKFAPQFTLTPGATIEPESGTELDFFKPQQYTVTSEDKAWHKTYTVSFVVDNSILFSYSFENVEVIVTENPEGRFHKFFDYLPDTEERKEEWDSGNVGFNTLAATLVSADEELTPEFYPTAQTPDGYIGKGVKMQTKATGPLGGMFGSPLAAGNLYLGYFSLTVPAIKSTRFGQPYNYHKAPKTVSGYFKYKAGGEFIVNNRPSELEKDTWDAYAILFEKQKDNNYLSGDHRFEDPRIVSIARIGDDLRIETDEWTPFEILFEYVGGKSFDPEAEYMYTLVFSSSKEGDRFNGAVGSTLWIDEVQITTEE